MTAAHRAYLGALAGALAILLWHPLARAFLLIGLHPLNTSEFLTSTRSLPENIERLDPPTTQSMRALWLQVGAGRIVQGKSVSMAQAQILASVANSGARADPDNAMWGQAEAAFLLRSSSDSLASAQAAGAAWLRASTALRWRDFENDRLSQVVDGLERETGRSMAWHYALAYDRRRGVLAQFAGLGGMKILRGQPTSVKLRLATLRNGVLLRRGSRSVASAEHGAALVDAAVLSVESTLENPRGRELARGEFFDLLTAEGSPREAIQAATAIAENDAWRALVATEDVEESFDFAAQSSVASSTAPGGMLAAAVLGAISMVLGYLLDAIKPLRVLFAWPWAIGSGIVGGLTVYATTRLIFPALWGVVCLASFGVGPDRVRHGPVEVRGVGLQVALTVLAVLVASSTAILMLHLSTPGLALADVLDERVWSKDATVWAGLNAVFLSVVVAVAPVWAFVHRFSAAEVLPIVLRRFGLALSLIGLTSAVILTPICAGIDVRLAESLAKMFQNEPNYYLTR